MANVEQAIIRTGGKQYRVEPGRSFKIEKLDVEVGSKLVFDEVLMTGKGTDATIGTPKVEGATVEATVTYQGRHKKLIVYKFRRRKNYRQRRGHRQYFTEVKIDAITAR
jgi:large subunit ribosomal protein L21